MQQHSHTEVGTHDTIWPCMCVVTCCNMLSQFVPANMGATAAGKSCTTTRTQQRPQLMLLHVAAAHCNTAQQPAGIDDHASHHHNPKRSRATPRITSQQASSQMLLQANAHWCINPQNCLAIKPRKHYDQSILCTEKTLHAHSSMERCLALQKMLLHSTHSISACCCAREGRSQYSETP
jgi:hypothetical protein